MSRVISHKIHDFGEKASAVCSSGFRGEGGKRGGGGRSTPSGKNFRIRRMADRSAEQSLLPEDFHGNEIFLRGVSFPFPEGRARSVLGVLTEEIVVSVDGNPGNFHCLQVQIGKKDIGPEQVQMAGRDSIGRDAGIDFGTAIESGRFPVPVGSGIFSISETRWRAEGCFSQMKKALCVGVVM